MTEPQKRPAYEPAERLLTPPEFDPAMRRPVSTVVGSLLVMLRVLAGVLQMLEVAQLVSTGRGNADFAVDDVTLTPEVVQAGVVVVLVGSGVVLLFEALLALLIYLGRNLPRVVVMVFAVASISASFVGWWAGGQEITLRTSFLSVALDILILLALSSRSAAAYARRNEQR